MYLRNIFLERIRQTYDTHHSSEQHQRRLVSLSDRLYERHHSWI
jgi:hypothetical protein